MLTGNLPSDLPIRSLSKKRDKSHKIARNSLDFGRHQSVTVPANWRTKMTKPVFNDAVVACLDEMHARLTEDHH
jgi:hypothetical protein